jgi:hypothetical protein
VESNACRMNCDTYAAIVEALGEEPAVEEWLEYTYNKFRLLVQEFKWLEYTYNKFRLLVQEFKWLEYTYNKFRLLVQEY